MAGKQKQQPRGTTAEQLKKRNSKAKQNTRTRRSSSNSDSSSRQGLSRKGPRERARATAAHASAARTRNTLAGIAQLHGKSGALHKKAEELHRSVKAAHITARKLHEDIEQNISDTTIPPVTGAEMERQAQPDGEQQERKYGKPFPIVGIGASAGGFEALNQFLAALPRDTGMAFVIVQHLDPSHKSQLTELLRRGAPLSVQEIRNNTDVEPNRIYVMPPNTSLRICEGKLRLSKRQRAEIPQMPVDRFFRSLAQDQLDLAIGVVLSGTGSDGTLGVEAIKGEGGVTFAQNESSSKYFGMPGSAIAAGATHFILPPKEIAEQLGRIAHHPYVAPGGKKPKKDATAEKEKLLAEGRRDLDTIFSLLRSRCNVDFSFYKHSTLRRRIVRRMILHRMEKLPAYVRFLEGHPAEVDALFNDLLINVTEFFRDTPVFQALQRIVFPRLLKGRSADSTLRIWVCGCSTGEETYSIAISLVEFFEKHRAHRPVQIFGTDISDMAVEKARAGIYPENIAQDVSSERLRRFFTKIDGHYQVQKAIRDMCIFARQNVIADPPFSNVDMVSCRNVLIYLGPMLQRKVIPMFHYALRPTGFLLLGTSETIGSSTDFFSLVNKKHKIYAKKSTFPRSSFELPHRASAHGDIRPPEVSAETAMPAEIKVPDLQQQVDKILLREFSPGAVVVNAQMDVLHFRGRTGAFLEHAPGVASLNLLKMARESLVLDLRRVLNRAMRQNGRIVQSGVHLRSSGQTRELTIEVVPFQLAPGSDRLYLVLFRESAIHELMEPARDARALAQGKPERDNRRTERLRLELSSTRQSLQSIIEEQDGTNEELKSANEEIQSTNEELQSTNEELETAKEELQSTNEELTTLNEELQNRNTELTVLNNDLTNLLSSVNVAILMLGEDLTIRRFTPMAEKLFNLIPSDVGRRLGDMNRSVIVPDLEQSIKEVIDHLTTIERDVQEREGRWYSLRIRPYRTLENKIEGAVIMLVDIDEMKRALDGVLSVVKQPLLTLSTDLKVRKANDCFCSTFGLRPAEVEDRSIYDIGSGEWKIPKLQTLLEAVLPDNRQVDDYEIEAKLEDNVKTKMRISARRFYAETRGMQMIFLAIEVVNGTE
jgi:two-component system, chemotaxis family, CheB/CheR fusion protein